MRVAMHCGGKRRPPGAASGITLCKFIAQPVLVRYVQPLQILKPQEQVIR
jgi:hypothetical protein